MPKIIYVQPDGNRHEVESEITYSVMEVAVNNDVPGIDADCRGGCACATCHVYVAPEWFERVGSPHALESEMLNMVDSRRETSRLSCQIRITHELDGLVVHTPESQGMN